jgi:hypothetical protein
MRDVIAGTIVSREMQRAPLMVLDKVTGVAETLIDFVDGLLSGGSQPPPTTAQAAQMQEIVAQRRARAAIDKPGTR